MATRKLSKRQKRIKIVVYIMVIAMVLSTLTAGLAMFL
ncbi:stressosome-associated protein Prli42 [Aquibacillus halophilus]|uniref:Stressosome-associated protein Prli42 n=1 Tax=Aquibacillus halophilus TaxID=930132 RepID=A0A6A8D957_9BACI|nr:stressosome-associated protein Prli42 [Aquibacillus halophilus]MRH42134.1 stressosome-associated protein Prli42 [Aquibacillus halophilus]